MNGKVVEEKRGEAAVNIKARREARRDVNMRDLEEAVNTINNFAAMYRKATMAVKNLERAQGKAGAPVKQGGLGGMFGGMGGDPFTSMMMGAVEQAVKQQATKLVEKKTAGMELPDSTVDLTAEEIAEAKEGLDGGTEEEEEDEE